MTDARRLAPAIAPLALAVLAGCALATSCDARELAAPAAAERLAVPDAPAVDAATVTIRGAEIAVDVARTPAAQRLGLGRYRSLAWGRGMIFPYAQQGFHAFWMKGMYFPIDIVFVRDGRIVEIASQVPAPPSPDADDPARVQPRELVDLVLEVPAGYAQAQGWRRGDRVSVEPSERPR